MRDRVIDAHSKPALTALCAEQPAATPRVTSVTTRLSQENADA
jgi:hypothetical protein